MFALKNFVGHVPPDPHEKARGGKKKGRMGKQRGGGKEEGKGGKERGGKGKEREAAHPTSKHFQYFCAHHSIVHNRI
jgi:hypothetical protein